MSANIRALDRSRGPGGPARPRGDRDRCRTRVQLVQIGDFAAPTYVTAPPGDASRVFVVERGGTVRVVRDGATLPAPFLDLGASATSTESERGLLSLAFAADYATSGRFWIFYTDAPTARCAWRRALRDPANPTARCPTASRRSRSRTAEGNHNGGQLAVGPDGAALHRHRRRRRRRTTRTRTARTSACATRRARADGTPLLGKILRIAPNPAGGYAIPAGNPFPAPGRRGVAAGAAQPVPLRVRPRDGRDGHRRTWGRRRSRRSTSSRPASSGLNFGWSYHEGNVPGPRAAPAGFAATAAGPRRSRARRASARSSAARSSATRRCRSSPVATSSATTASGRSGPRPSTAARRAAGDARTAHGPVALLVRRGRVRPRVRHVARGARVPDRRRRRVRAEPARSARGRATRARRRCGSA